MTLRTVHLYGELADEFGCEFRLHAPTVGHAMRLLEANFSGRFYKAIHPNKYYVVAGKDLDGLGLTEEQHLTTRLGSMDLHIVPEAYGAKSGKGFFGVLLGVVLIGAAIIASGGFGAVLGGNFIEAAGGAAAGVGGGAAAGFSGAILGISSGTVALAGAALLLGGLSSLLMSTPKSGAGGDSLQSFVFGGPVNVAAQGGARSLIYGRVMIGSVVVSSSLRAEDVPTDGSSGGAGGGGGGFLGKINQFAGGVRFGQ